QRPSCPRCAGPKITTCLFSGRFPLQQPLWDEWLFGDAGATGSDCTLPVGLSYILLLTAFYVDNGKNLLLWNRLLQIAFWLLPGAVGIQFIVRALLTYSLLRRLSDSAHSAAVRR